MFLLINKPTGITSHDVISRLRRITGIRKIGHAGTLDPFATGLLVVAINRESTKEIDSFVKLDKEYVATVKFGAESDTYDRTGEIVPLLSKEGLGVVAEAVDYSNTSANPLQLPLGKGEGNALAPSLEAIQKVVNFFIGRQLQIPPMYSATKVGGQKLYELARQGKKINLGGNDIEIYDIKILDYTWPLLKISVRCSSGTYIRSLAHDIGEKLGCGAYLEELERTKIGKFDLKNAVKLEELTADNWRDFGIRN